MAADNTLTVGELAIVISAVVPILIKEGLMDASGAFTAGSVQDWARVATDIETELKKYLIVPAKVDQILAILPVLLQAFGVK